MVFLKRYLIPRLVQYVLVIWLGITVVFFIPRLTPNDPIMRMIGEMRARGSYMEPSAMDGIINDLTEMYGLQGSWIDQYWAFGAGCSAVILVFPISNSPRALTSSLPPACPGLWDSF